MNAGRRNKPTAADDRRSPHETYAMTIPVAQPGKTRIGWIGTGVMGRWMCQHAITNGYATSVYNRSKDKLQPLLELGAKAAASPKAVAEQSDIVFAIVGFPKDVREVFLGASGALAGAKPGTVLVDMTTSEPTLAKEIYEAAKAKSVASLDAQIGRASCRERVEVLGGAIEVRDQR